MNRSVQKRIYDGNFFKAFSINTIRLWLGLFTLAPLLLMIIVSLLSYNQSHFVKLPFNLTSYQQLINLTYIRIFLRSLLIAAICTLLCLLFAYPFAFFLAQIRSRCKYLLLLLVIIPFWTSSLIRTYAIMGILKANGLLNKVLLGLGIIHQPLQLLFTNTAVMIGLIYALLPFMILPLYANIEKLDQNLLNAARDLGANKLTIFRRIILPLTMPGILAGTLLVFLPAMTLFYIPTILGGAKSMLLGNLIQNQFLQVGNWPLGAALGLSLIPLMVILYFVYRKSSQNQELQELL